MTICFRTSDCVPKKGIGENTLNQIYTYGKNNKLCLETPLLKLLKLEVLNQRSKQHYSINQYDTKVAKR